MPGALVALGAGLLLVGFSLDGAGARVVGANLAVDEGATVPLDITAHNSPTLVQSPADAARLVVVDRIDSPVFSCALHRSPDAGATWSDAEIPFPVGEEDPPRCYAPDAAFGPDGTLHVSFVTLEGLGNTPHALWVASSIDGGRRFSAPVRVSGPLAFQARLTADPQRKGRLYLSWLQASAAGLLLFPEPGNPVVVARSDDGGVTWGAPVRVTPVGRSRVVAPSAAVGPGGELFVSYLDLGADALDYHGGHEGRGGEPYQGRWAVVMARSVDGGATWEEAVVDDQVVPTQRFVVFLPPVPSLAIDRSSGRVYVGFHDGRLGDPDVWVWASGDGGRHFGPAVRVNDTAERDGTAQYLPMLAVSRGGRLDVVYYDRRGDRRDVRTEASLQSSLDGGRSFWPRVRLSDRAFDSRIGLGSDRGMPDLGSRLALVSTERRAVAAWTDTRAGTQGSNKQDIARAVVAVTPGSPARAQLRAGGAAAALAGLVLLGQAARGGQGRRGTSPGPTPTTAPLGETTPG